MPNRTADQTQDIRSRSLPPDKPMTEYVLFATAPKGVEPLLAEELQTLGAVAIRPGRGGVLFNATLATAYRACLWSRMANRILLRLTSFAATDAEDLYRGVRALPWEDHGRPDGTLTVDFASSHSPIGHTRFGAQKVKDAIVDRYRERRGCRPTVQHRCPDLRINCYWLNDLVTVYLDLSGESLHRRGYREETVVAPLKENLAAALLIKAGWPAIAAAGGALLDPACGSGTLAIEAALMAADIAPGLWREHWGFSGWPQHDPAIWDELLAEAHQRRDHGVREVPAIVGCDRDAAAVRAAQINAGRAGVQALLRFERRELRHADPPAGVSPGLVMVNPPYGERLGELPDLERLYAQLGDRLKERFAGWQAAVFTANPELGKRMRLRARKVNAYYNGALACKLLHFSVEPSYFVDREAADARARSAVLEAALAAGADAFANRLRKNRRTLGRWAERQGIPCYRLYDADLPEYAVAVDVYEQWVHVQEYQAPTTVDRQRAQERLEHVMAVLPAVLEMPPERVFLKVRRRQKGLNQYQKRADGGRCQEVREGNCRFLVNFHDYLDTGLFLDHRLTRQLIGELAAGRRFLNLFAYTGTATVYAALNGASTTTSVDLSRTYLSWAERNLALNGVDLHRHDLVQADCLDWLEKTRQRFDLIFLDPPTFSNSKRMEGTLDVQRDHVELIRKTARLLDKEGILLFSTNNRRFRLDERALAEFRLKNITRQTIPRDFQRDPRIHQCWRIERMMA